MEAAADDASRPKWEPPPGGPILMGDRGTLHPMASSDAERAFRLELRYSDDQKPVPRDFEDGILIGSGHGFIEGPRVRGTLRWSNYETAIRDGLCRLQVPAIVSTQDGAEIHLEALGYALRTDATGPTWFVAGALRFETAHPAYVWLNGRLALFEGEFDEKTLIATYRGVFSPTDSNPSAERS